VVVAGIFPVWKAIRRKKMKKKPVFWGVTETGAKLHARPYPEASHSMCNEYMYIHGNILPKDVNRGLLCKTCLKILQKEGEEV